MKQITLLIILLSLSISLLSQTPITYINEDNESHLCGPISISDLKHLEWFEQSYNNISLSNKNHKWTKQLKNIKVKIFLGTWCGDSKREVPRFIKLWNELGLDESQLEIIALYDDDARYKQGPNGEEKNMKVHRVPTFIFEQSGTEIGRIVEKPMTDLETDIAQIALGYPTTANYKAANYLLKLYETVGVEAVKGDRKKYINVAYKLVSKSNELNTLGYVLLRAGQIDEAVLAFRWNTRFFRYEPNVYDSYAEALAISGDVDGAIVNYNKVLDLDPSNEHALRQITTLMEN